MDNENKRNTPYMDRLLIEMDRYTNQWYKGPTEGIISEAFARGLEKDFVKYYYKEGPSWEELDFIDWNGCRLYVALGIQEELITFING